MLEEAIGYTGNARLVAFYWTPGSVIAVYDDGHMAGDGDWRAYLTYVQHPSLRLRLAPYNLGASEYPADYWLILDRETRMLHGVPEREARWTLRQQGPTVETRPVLDPAPIEQLSEVV